MYRVAVIQNETEMLISGYANVVKQIRTLERFKDYSFETFTIVNLHKLFDNSDFSLREFDSLIITTNATSDSAVLSMLRKNSSAIEQFLLLGKGLFVGSQKKLSASQEELTNDSSGKIGKTQFLPDLYEYYTTERPKIEKDSGKGTISLNPNLDKSHDNIVTFPNHVAAQDTQCICENNGFRRHIYRSHIVPVTPDTYTPLFVDNTTDPTFSRMLLVSNSTPRAGERIVLSTIAIDWEFHQNLLVNIIVFITEGLPKLAFIDIAEKRHGDFDFLLTGARLSKVSHSIYTHPNEINKEMFAIHDTYVFSPDWDEMTVESFIGKISTQQSKVSRYNRQHVVVNYFRKMSNGLLLSQYANFNSMDLIVQNSIVWLISKFEEKMWGGSFWISYAVLTMMLDLDIDVSSHIPLIFKDINRHYSAGSYDAVVGATCGLLELTALLYHKYPKLLENIQFGRTAISQMHNWVIENISSISDYDLQTISLTSAKITQFLTNPGVSQTQLAKLQELQQKASEDLDKALEHLEDCTEMDLCRYLSLCILLQKQSGQCETIIQQLKILQAINGRWTNVGRTGHVLTFLIKNLHEMESLISNPTSINIADIIYQGILYLRSEYKADLGNWDNDLQATAKAVHAIGLYNDSFQYSTQDFFRTLERDRETMQYTKSLNEIGQNMNKIRSRMILLENKHEALLKTRNELQQVVDENEVFELKLQRENQRIRTAITVVGSMLLSLLLTLGINYFDTFEQLFSEVGSLINIVVAFIFGLLLTNFVQRTIVKKEVISDIKRPKPPKGSPENKKKK